MCGSVHLYPRMKSIITVSGRVGMDLIHQVTRGNRKFLLMAREEDMRGFVVELKHITPTLVRNETLVEVEGVDRMLVFQLGVPEDRRELYRDGEGLKFARGTIVKDTIKY